MGSQAQGREKSTKATRSYGVCFTFTWLNKIKLKVTPVLTRQASQWASKIITLLFCTFQVLGFHTLQTLYITIFSNRYVMRCRRILHYLVTVLFYLNLVKLELYRRKWYTLPGCLTQALLCNTSLKVHCLNRTQIHVQVYLSHTVIHHGHHWQLTSTETLVVHVWKPRSCPFHTRGFCFKSVCYLFWSLVYILSWISNKKLHRPDIW